MPAQGDFLRITALGTLRGATNPVINTWDYQIIQQPLPVGLQDIGEEIAAAFVARYYAPLSDVISNQYALTGISIRTYGKPFEGWDGADDYFIGGVGGTAMPPFVAYSVMRLRDNFSMHQGRKSFAGVPTSSIGVDGFPIPTVRDVFTNVFSAWEDTDFFVEVQENDMLLSDRLVRAADLKVVPTVVSAVRGYQLRGYGSQNGRKG